jgi:hypothetical protein
MVPKDQLPRRDGTGSLTADAFRSILGSSADFARATGTMAAAIQTVKET